METSQVDKLTEKCEETQLKSDTEKYSKFFYAMLNRGIYLAPSPYELAFLGITHNQKILEETLKAAEDTLRNREL